MKTKQMDLRKLLTNPPVEVLSSLPVEVQRMQSQTGTVVHAEHLPNQTQSQPSQDEQRRQRADAMDQPEQTDGRDQSEQPGPDNTQNVRQPLTIQGAANPNLQLYARY